LVTPKEQPAGWHYIHQWWKNRETGEPYAANYGKFAKSMPGAKQKFHASYEAGQATGLKMATPNLGEILGEQLKAASKAKATRELYKTLGETGIVKRYERGVSEGEGFIRYHDTLLDRPIAFKTPDGKTMLIKTDAAIRQDFLPQWRAYRESGDYGKAYRALVTIPRTIKLGLSLFHPKNLIENVVLTGHIPFKGAGKALRALRSANDPVVNLLYKQGLTATAYEDLKPIHFIPGTKLIFEVIQPALKTAWAKDEFIARSKKFPTMPKDQLARQVVKAADSFFSGEDVKRAGLEAGELMNKIYFSPGAKKAWRAAFLSPTWQREHLLIGKRGVQSWLPEKWAKSLGFKEDISATKGIYRRYAFNAALTYTGFNLINYITTKKMDGQGKFMLANPKGYEFSIRMPYNDKNGNAVYVRPAKSLFEIPEITWDLLHADLSKVASKLNPMVPAVVHQLYPAYGQTPNWLERGGQALQDIGLPITGQSMLAAAQGKKQLPDVLLPFLGFPTARYKPKSTQLPGFMNFHKSFGNKSGSFFGKGFGKK
jgi:hypothetical protein